MLPWVRVKEPNVSDPAGGWAIVKIAVGLSSESSMSSGDRSANTPVRVMVFPDELMLITRLEAEAVTRESLNVVVATNPDDSPLAVALNVAPTESAGLTYQLAWMRPFFLPSRSPAPPSVMLNGA